MWKERVFWAEGWLERRLGIERMHQAAALTRCRWAINMD